MTFVPPFIVLTGLLVAVLSSGRIVSIRRRRYPRSRVLTEAIALSTFALAVLAVAAISGFDAITSAVHGAPGSMYAVDGHRMRIDCEGAGSPTIVLDAGLGNDGLIWSAVQPALARSTRVCSFDRAGYGWSQPTSTPRDADHVSAELHGLLMAAGIRGSIILMGHSIAGLYIRDYANRYPGEVVGLVFVDASNPNPDHFPWSSKDRQPGPRSPLERWVENAVFALELNHLVGACPGSLPGFRMRLTAPRLEGLCREHLNTFVGEKASFAKSSMEAAAASSFGELPILIISRWTQDKSWNQKQESLKRLSINSRRIIAAHSGHYVQVERPGLVENQVRLFVEQIRVNAHELTHVGPTQVL
jgi:pimeloyl-ACP methyl ester carboxylesterase